VALLSSVLSGLAAYLINNIEGLRLCGPSFPLQEDDMITFTKDNAVKVIDDNSDLIPVLLKDGWVSDDVIHASDDLEALKAEATELGITFHHKAGVAKLKELLAAAKG